VNLYFSEYLEGSGNNKALEIFNADTNGNTADLTLVAIEIYLNGAPSPSSSIALPAGDLAPGELFVLANSAAVTGLQAVADTTSASVNFTGNDAVVLLYNGGIVDVIGEIGSDVAFGENQTLRRDCAVTQGDRDGSDPFDATAEFSNSDADTFDGLGTRGCP